MIAAVDGANEKSIKLHERLGFVEVARMPEVGANFWAVAGPGALGTPAGRPKHTESGLTPHCGRSLRCPRRSGSPSQCRWLRVGPPRRVAPGRHLHAFVGDHGGGPHRGCDRSGRGWRQRPR